MQQRDSHTDSGRKADVLTTLSAFLARQLQLRPAQVENRRPFLELGADSIVFIDMAHLIDSRFGVRVAAHQLFEELTHLDALADFVARNATRMPPVDSYAPAVEVCETAATLDSRVDFGHSAAAASAGLAPDSIEPLLRRQLEVMAQQLRLLGNHGGELVVAAGPPARPEPGPGVDTAGARAGASASRSALPGLAAPSHSAALTDTQASYLRDFTVRYTERTAASKALAQRYRAFLADRRATVGFALESKELLYPIVGSSAAGSRIWDVDGNEYIDFAMGYGIHLFGHNPSFIGEALRQEAQTGRQIGPQSLRAGELAETICRITGMERVTFCNSGTEAVMTAIRLARAGTGRDTIAIFKGSYHGHSDATLALGRRVDGRIESAPMAPGVPQRVVDNVLVLEYGTEESLDLLRARGRELAAVLVEAVQSRRPDLQPREFLHRLRDLTAEAGAALIFDEVITGFRVHSRGCQGLFGIEADIATYGKLLGGGMPIGVVAGRRAFMDRIDGGEWSFGDDSFPAVETTFFAGTFSKHPATVAASLAVLGEIEREGPELYRGLEAKTAALARRLNSFFDEQGLSLRVAHCGSMFRFGLNDNSLISYLYEPLEIRLFYHHLIAKGFYFWEGRTAFLSTAHSEEDLDELIEAVRETIAEMRAGGFFAPAARRKSVTPAPLSWAQEGIWFQSELGRGSGTFNMTGGVRLRGDLGRDLLERAVREIIRRHDVLRMSVDASGDQPRQVFTPASELEFAIEELDWQNRSKDDQERDLRALIEDEARRPFDLEKAPLLRLSLVALGPREWVLLTSLHHLIGDGWSFGIFVRELATLYRAYSAGAASSLSPLPELTMQYGDYARDQRGRTRGEALEQQLGYWTRQLDGAPTVLALPTDRPRHPKAGFRSAALTQTLAPELLEQVRRVGQSSSATLHMMLLSVFALLLQRHTGQDDLLIGAPVVTRDRAELRSLIGLFVNTLVFRVRVTPESSFAELLRQVRRVTLDGYSHQDAPFEEVVRALQPERRSDRHPLFQVWYNMDLDADAAALRLPGLEVEALEEQVDTPNQLDLSLYVQMQGGQLVLRWIFNEALFERSTIEHLARQFELLLERVVADPEARVDSYSLVDPRATELLPDPTAELAAPAYRPVTESFLRLAEQSPAHPALRQGEHCVTYEDLRERTAAIAGHLELLGQRGDVVAVRGAPSSGLVASLIAVMHSGRVLLPIDPDLPPRRQAAMLQEANAKLLLQVGRDAGLDGDTVVPVGILDADGSWVAPPESHRVEGGSVDAEPAYIFYTSGTTGIPKGVLGTHSGVAHFVDWQRQTFDVGSGDTVAQATRLSFDAILRDIFLPLTSGATICLPEPDDLLEPSVTLDWLRRQRVTILHAVPSLARHWTSEATAETQLPDLRLVFFAGEPLQADLAVRWTHLAPAAEVINLYGPTETTMTKLYYRVPEDVRPGVQPVGQPLPNTQALVLNANRKLCGIGEIGEIVLRTPYRTRGYINAPAEQQQRFVLNPFGSDADDLVYFTGDRGRHGADGHLQVLGRLDRQVKLRGVRIELGELESVLDDHPSLVQASVQVVDENGARRRLAAFVVAADPPPTAEHVMAFLRERLPESMLPSRIVFLDRLPLLANGKVDGASLISLPATAPDVAAPPCPVTPTQSLVIQYARDLLGVESLDIHDNFFAVGGHSLLAAQLAARLRRALGVNLELRALFEAPTVAGISAQIDADPGASARALAITLQGQQPDDVVAAESFEL